MIPVPATPDPPDEEAIRCDERERLSARVYENGWCPTCAHKADPDAMPPHEVAAILVDPAEVLSPEEVAEYERCQQSVIDARRRAPMVEGQMIVGAAASPDERLREADRAVILEWAKFTRDESAGYWGRREEDVYQRLLAAADRPAATPDPPNAADLVAAHLRERWPCTCRPGMDGGGVYHAADCNSRREGSQAVLAVIRLLRAANPPASPDERLREALREIVRQVEEYPALSPTGIMVRDDIAGMVEGTARAALAATDRDKPEANDG